MCEKCFAVCLSKFYSFMVIRSALLMNYICQRVRSHEMEMLCRGYLQNSCFITLLRFYRMLEEDSCASFTTHLADCCILLLALTSDLVIFIFLNMILKSLLVCCFCSMMNTLPSHPYEDTFCRVVFFLTALNNSKFFYHSSILKLFQSFIRIIKYLTVFRREEVRRWSLTYSIEHNLKKNEIKIEMSLPY